MNLLISGCLLGLACRYDGVCKPLPAEILQKLREKFTLIPVCPEQLGGLSTPRNPAERIGDKVISSAGVDVTAEYQKGAQEVWKLAEFFDCRMVLLKEKSPACGKDKIYDGTFSRTLIPGSGVAAEFLQKKDILVYGESEIEKLLAARET